MSKIIYLPLEHIEQRYTQALDRDITEYLESNNIEHIKIYPDIPNPATIKKGSFLDAEFTIRFKAEQIALKWHVYIVQMKLIRVILYGHQTYGIQVFPKVLLI